MPLFHYLPYCVLASIIEVAVVGIIEYSAMKDAWRVSRQDFAVSISTFVAVLGFGVEVGLVVGVGISISLLLIRSSQPRMAQLGRVDSPPDAATAQSKSAEFKAAFPVAALEPEISWEHGTWRSLSIASAASPVPGCIVLRVDGGIIFTSTGAISDKATRLVDEYSVDSAARADFTKLKSFILDMGLVHDLDLSGMHMLQSLDFTLGRRGVTLVLAQPTEPVRDALSRMMRLKHSGTTADLGERIFGTIDESVGSCYPPRQV